MNFPTIFLFIIIVKDLYVIIKFQHSNYILFGFDLFIIKVIFQRVIFMFCLLFSTIFGAVILMSNLNSLKENKGKWQVLLFALLYTAGHAYTVFNFSTTYIGLMLNLGGALILTEYFWNRYIGMEREFIRKSWTKPAIVSALITVPLIVAAVLTNQ